MSIPSLLLLLCDIYQQSDYSVPHLAELKASCAEQIAAYRQCLEKHSSQPDEVISKNCGGLMKTLWECTEKTVADIEKREAGEKKLV